MSDPIVKPLTAVDIAAYRVRDFPTDSVEARIQKAAAYQYELRRAKDEIERGEWESGELSSVR